jgi:hypothetical protein
MKIGSFGKLSHLYQTYISQFIHKYLNNNKLLANTKLLADSNDY